MLSLLVRKTEGQIALDTSFTLCAGIRVTALSILITLYFPFCLFSQNNLVPNPSFEEYDTCPNDQGQAYLAKYWNSFGNSPEYFNSCVTLVEFSTPHNILGWQIPFNGNAYIGCGLFATHDTLVISTIREFVGVELIAPLTIGESYSVYFYVSVADSPNAGNVVHNKIGALFSTQSFAVDSFCPTPCETSLLLPKNYAHVYSDSIIHDMENWIKISGSFIADSAYRYLIIGNFFTNDNISFIPINSRPPSLTKGSYYYIDEVYVGEDTTVGISEDFTINKVKIFPNPATDNVLVSLINHNNLQKIVQLTIIDIFGKELYSQVMRRNETEIFLENFSSGIYFIKINSGNKCFVHKLIISK
jgi:hypothetical protein